MFTKTAIALVIMAGTASGALAGAKQSSSTPNGARTTAEALCWLESSNTHQSPSERAVR
jgi:hypothetical protein